MTKSKKKQVIPQQCHLSDDLIIEEILTRLPVKSILQFKSVSKQWYSTLSSSNFANAHLKKSPFSHPSAPVHTLFINKCGNIYYLFSYNDDQISSNFEDNLAKLDPETGFEKHELELTGCCNGLVCLAPFSNSYFIIWNPATRKMHKYKSNGYVKFTDDVTSGFGYASSVDDYKYVRIVNFGARGLGTEQYNMSVHIFSLRENKWRKIDFDHHVIIIHFGLPVTVNEKLYWLAHCSQAGHVTLSFDLGAETFDIFKGRDYYLGVMGGCLSKCSPDSAKSANTNDMLMHIFESPSIVKSIGLPKGLSLDVASQMIGFTRTDKFFVTGPVEDEDEVRFFQSRTLGIVDTSTKPVQYARLLRFDDRIAITRYVPSLVSPFPIGDLSSA